MGKHLAKLGNSLALIIERPILVMLGITTKTELKLYTDGLRIIIEPLRRAAPCDRDNGDDDDDSDDDAPVTSPAERIGTGLSFEQRLIPAYQIWKRHSFDGHFKELGEGRRWLDYLGRLKHRMPDEWTMRVMDRIEVCCEELDEGRTWDEAIATSLAEVPVPLAPGGCASSAPASD